jgi:hypothetical protein
MCKHDCFPPDFHQFQWLVEIAPYDAFDGVDLSRELISLEF